MRWLPPSTRDYGAAFGRLQMNAYLDCFERAEDRFYDEVGAENIRDRVSFCYTVDLTGRVFSVEAHPANFAPRVCMEVDLEIALAEPDPEAALVVMWRYLYEEALRNYHACEAATAEFAGHHWENPDTLALEG